MLPALLTLIGGCAPEPAPLPVTPVGPGVVHLIDIVSDAHVHLAREKPADVVVHSLFHSLEGWAVQGDQAAVTADGSLRITSTGSQPPVVSRQVELQPRTTYRLRGRLQTTGLAPRGARAEGAAIEVIELGAGGRVVARHDQMLRERGTTPWRSVSLDFTTHPTTVAAKVELVAARGPTQGEAAFDDLVLEVVPASEGITLWPSRGRSQWARAATVTRETRPSLALPKGASWTLPVLLETPATLSTGIAALSGGGCFAIRRGSEEVARACVESGRPWQELSIPLPAGPSTLAFDATAPIGLWGDPSVSTPTPRRQPNLVLILVDTLRADHLGSAGEALAASGLRFDQAHTTSSWTAPSVGSLFTSRYPSHHRAGGRLSPEREPTDDANKAELNQLKYLPLSAAVPTLAQHLRAAGYETVGLETNFFVSAAMGFDRGFERYISYTANDDEGGRRAIPLVEDLVRGRSEDDPPLFLLVHFIDPHMPYRVRAPFREGVEVPHLSAVEEPSGTLVLGKISPHDRPFPKEVKAMYTADTRWSDQAVAEVLAALTALPDTAVLLTADHGEGFAEHGAYVHGNSAYEELLHIPLALRLPDGAHAGEVRTEPVSLLDVAPTFLALAGAPADPTFEGTSLIADPIGPRTLFFEAMYTGPDRTGVLSGDLKYVRTWPEPSGRAGREELFDLRADPGETTDLLGALPADAARLREQVERFISENEPGFHVRCRESATFDLAASEAIREIAVRRLRGQQTLDPDRHGLRLKLDDGDWLIVRTQRPATIKVQSGDAGPCAMWEVRADRGVAPTVGNDVREQLEVLGYLDGDG